MLAAAFAALSRSPAQAQPRYAITDLGPIGNVVSIEPFDRMSVNSSGTVVLWNWMRAEGVVHAMRYQNGEFTDLGMLAGDTASKSWGLNDAGDIVGSSGSMTSTGGLSPSFTRRRAVVFTASGPREFSSAATIAAAINDAGSIVGEGTGGAFVYAGGVFRLITMPGSIGGRARDINARGDVVGALSLQGGVRHAFLYRGGVAVDLGTLGGQNSGAEAINDDGVVVGWSNIADGTIRAFRYENGIMSELPSPTGTVEMRAHAMNRRGDYVGYVRAPFTRAFVSRGGVMTELNDLIPLRVGTGVGFSGLWYACGINDGGLITGIGSYYGAGATQSEQHAFLLTPVSEVMPATTTITAGSTAVLNLISGLPATSYQWLHNGTSLAGETNSALVLFAADPAAAGSYACRVTTTQGEFLSSDATMSVVAGAVPARLSNLSVFTTLADAADNFTVATVIAGGDAAATKPLLVRAVGPSLSPLGVPGVLVDPRLEFYSGSAKTNENDNWNGNAAAASGAAAVGAFALSGTGSRDAALWLETAPGDKSVRVFGTGAGAVIAEIYDGTPAEAFTPATPRLTNLSVLKPIGTNLTAGFVIAGTTAKTVLVRAVGPTLAATFRLPNVVADPKLTLFAGGKKLAENDNWGAGPSAARMNEVCARTGAFFLGAGSNDSALLVTLSPGSYTVSATDGSQTNGTVLLEVYEVP